MKAILVTGANRSGTTWVGKMLSCSNQLLPVWEPFNYLMPPESKLAGTNPLKEQYHYLLEKETTKMKMYLNRRIISAAYLASKPKVWGAIDNLMCLAINSKQVLFKDPIALLSAEWIAQEYQAQVIVLIRHPAAYVNSIKRVNWDMSLECLLPQTKFIETLPPSLVDEIRDRLSHPLETDGYNLEDAALSWKVFHQVIYQYQQTHPEWIFVRHEDLCRDFYHEFQSLYGRLGLSWDESVKQQIAHFCGRPNNQELGSQIHILNRHSPSVSDLWKQCLTPQEVSRIKEITQEVADLFYDSDSWIHC